ncbi:hypothetical protein FA364_20055, partial [Pseudomonas aeruginosa]|nr:hypothetical protein [Pseudomonas aeruginosa]
TSPENRGAPESQYYETKYVRENPTSEGPPPNRAGPCAISLADAAPNAPEVVRALPGRPASPHGCRDSRR